MRWWYVCVKSWRGRCGRVCDASVGAGPASPVTARASHSAASRGAGRNRRQTGVKFTAALDAYTVSDCLQSGGWRGWRDCAAAAGRTGSGGVQRRSDRDVDAMAAQQRATHCHTLHHRQLRHRTNNYTRLQVRRAAAHHHQPKYGTAGKLPSFK